MKSNQRHVYGLILCLFLLGTGLFLYRHFILDVPLTDTETVNSWMVESNLRFTADKNAPVKASFIIPYLPPYYAILDEYFVSHNYGVTTNLKGYNRQTVWSLRRGHGAQSLYYRAIFRETDNNESVLPKPPMVKAQVLDENQKSAVDTISNIVRPTSADIQTFAQETIKELNKKDGNAKLLVGPEFNEENVIKAAILILNQAKIYAMPVKGIYLNQQSHAEFKLFMAVYNDKEWFYINPRTGGTGLPKTFLVWQYGSEPLFEVNGGKKASFNLTVSPTPINALSIAKTRGLQTDSQLLRFSLLQLPVNVQETYKILLTVPIGAFIILLLRNFIGLKTFGTFMPVLIALAFRETHVIWGIVLFVFIVSFGLLARFYLDQLKLLLVPRLAAILTVVILLMIFVSVMSQNLGLESGLSVALFPMVILTMTIERMCITWDERGASEAIRAGVGSLVAAVIAFGAMNYPPLQYLVFAFPELLLVLLALILLFGQYRGYRLFELFRFKALAGEH
ncbi:membrane-associated HD superfamily hydrolase [Legionella quinlivanii]|uniref:Membrane-associated HD superfamily hydrolase n=1 Tax=Legionella quinlivanii TaxID=45073 RepID=A0A0W0Y4T7_9GAMM|nr:MULTISPECIES: inactive transglutaminase family protein [Legionella]KTD51928.1 membrane-associated HD superfamily hydrolase [Legionella quinlivanii]MCE3046377.1 inactive transglutaminase family protein [Legionella sp. 16cNR16C]SEF85084.1 Inactive transglutaminase fused to 7 transmembrane helices [Legionella quinlivanii DSM 21216]STY09609.1 membrane-associated HD superfamily hydrolase [Legionella quinlivanii]